MILVFNISRNTKFEQISGIFAENHISRHFMYNLNHIICQVVKKKFNLQIFAKMYSYFAKYTDVIRNLWQGNDDDELNNDFLILFSLNTLRNLTKI
jgi:hypothetical protein